MDEGKKEDGAKMAAPAAVSGPAIGLEQVFREHHGRVFRAAYRVTGNPSDAEDVMQTVFMRLARQGWSGWCLRCARQRSWLLLHCWHS